MAKLGSGHRQMQSVIDRRKNATDKFLKSSWKFTKKHKSSGSGFLSLILNATIWIFKAMFIFIWWLLKFTIWFLYMMVLYIYQGILFLVQKFTS